MSEQPRWVLGAMRAHPALTAAGLARRRSMGGMLQAAVVSRRRRRKAFRWAGGGALTLVFALLLFPGISPETVSEGLEHVAFEIVRDDPGILARYAARPAAIPVETWIEDDELLDLLRSADRATGLIRIDDRVILTGDVTDNSPE